MDKDISKTVDYENVNTEDKTSQIDSSILRQNVKNMCMISFFAVFSYAIFAPIEYYFANKQEMWCDLYDLLPVSVGVFFIIYALLLVVVFAVWKKQKLTNIIGCIITALSICLYIQGNFVIIPFEIMNGEAIDWSRYAGYNFSSVSVWLGIICLCTVMFVKYWKEGKALKIAKIVLLCMVLNELLTITVAGNQCNGFEAKNDLKGVTEGKWDYSENDNMFILLLDTMDSRVMENTLLQYDSEKTRHSINYTFEDFTFFRDTMGAFSLTDYSIPQILTGELYLGGDESYNNYIERSYVKSPFLNRLKDEGWSVNIHAASRMPQGEGAKGIDNLRRVKYKIADYKEFVKIVYGLVNFRYFPTPIKQYVYCDGSYLFFTSEVDTIDGKDYDYEEWYDHGTDEYWDNNLFYYGMQNIKASKQEKVMHFYHLKGIHALRDVDNKFQIIQEQKDMYSLEQETTVVINLINAWIYFLKQNNVYDDSIIVIMGDHGSVRYGDDHNYGQAPVLMIKGKGENHDFTISDAPLSYMDLQNIFRELLDGKSSIETANKVLEDDGLFYSDYNEFDLDEYMEILYNPQEIYDTTGRRREMIYHFFEGDLGDNNKGGEGYELFTDYPTFYGSKIEATGTIYK